MAYKQDEGAATEKKVAPVSGAGLTSRHINRDLGGNCVYINSKGSPGLLGYWGTLVPINSLRLFPAIG